MQDRILIKRNGEYITLPELMREVGLVILEYKPAANQIQVKEAEQGFDGFRAGKSLGALKHNFTGEPVNPADAGTVRYSRWIRIHEDGPADRRCERCGYTETFSMPFCAKCGAKMLGGVVDAGAP